MITGGKVGKVGNTPFPTTQLVAVIGGTVTDRAHDVSGRNRGVDFENETSRKQNIDIIESLVSTNRSACRADRHF